MNIKETLTEVLYSILPVTAVILLLQVTLVRFPWSAFAGFLLSTVLAIAGLTLFLLGVRDSLLSVGEQAGITVMKSGKLWFVISSAVAVGFAVTVAEPGVQVLAGQVDSVSDGDISRYLLVAVVSMGVGIFLALSMLRIIYRLPLTLLLLGGYGLVFILAGFAPPEFFTVALDAGGATTGPVTVPFILSLGVGISTIRGSKAASEDSFGYVGLASVGPILAVLLLGVAF